MAKPVLVGYDPRGDDRAPVDFGAAVAGFTGAPLIVAAVASGGAPGTDADLVQDCDAEIARVETALGEQGLQVTCRVLRSTSAARALHEAAEALEAGLLVVGSTRRSPAGRVLPGSTAERLLHGAPCPVAVVPQAWSGEAGPPATIGVGFDDGPEGHAALQAAHALARRTGARLRVLHAVRDDLRMFGELEPKYPGRLDRIDLDDAEGERKLAAERAIRALLTPLGDDVAADVDVVVDDPADALVELSGHVDLLVCGSRGYGPLRAVLLGSVARRVTAAARCPVIVLPRGVGGAIEDLVGAETATRQTSSA